MSLVYEVTKEAHQCISGLGGPKACKEPAHFHVGSKDSWRRRQNGGGVFYFTCEQHRPASAGLRGAPKAWKVVVDEKPLTAPHSMYRSALLAASVIRGALGRRNVKVVRA